MPDRSEELLTHVINISAGIGRIEQKADDTNTQVVNLADMVKDQDTRLITVETHSKFVRWVVAPVGGIAAAVGTAVAYFKGLL